MRGIDARVAHRADVLKCTIEVSRRSSWSARSWRVGSISWGICYVDGTKSIRLKGQEKSFVCVFETGESGIREMFMKHKTAKKKPSAEAGA